MEIIKMNAETWHSVYIYYNETYEICLIKVIKPLIEFLSEQNFVVNYFFVKYNDGSPHVRFRVKSLYDLEPIISEYLLTNTSKNGVINSYSWVPYIPEIERYGGPDAMIVAEDQFNHSSKIVLDILSENDFDWTYDLAIGHAIQFHVIFASEMGMTKQEAVLFFKSSFIRWLSMASKPLQMKSTDLFEIFNKSFLKQKSKLISFVKLNWDDSEEHLWRILLKDISYKLKQLEIDNRIIYPSNKIEVSKEFPIWHIYDSLCHMTNNRLGVLNRDEAYIYFIIFNSLIVLNES